MRADEGFEEWWSRFSAQKLVLGVRGEKPTEKEVAYEAWKAACSAIRHALHDEFKKLTGKELGS